MSKNKHGSLSFGKGVNRIVLTHLNKPIGDNGLVGMVTSGLFQEPLAVVIDQTPPEDRDYDFACLACGLNGVAPRILFDKEIFYDIKRGSIEAKVILLHEIGHYCHGHLLQKNDNQKSIREKQISAGIVSPNELQADLFAASYIGRDNVVFGLRKLMDRIRANYSNYDESIIAPAIEELQLRINALL